MAKTTVIDSDTGIERDQRIDELDPDVERRNAELGLAFQEKRRVRFKSQQEFAGHVNCSVQAVGKFEQGRGASLVACHKFARAIGAKLVFVSDSEVTKIVSFHDPEKLMRYFTRRGLVTSAPLLFAALAVPDPIRWFFAEPQFPALKADDMEGLIMDVGCHLRKLDAAGCRSQFTAD